MPYTVTPEKVADHMTMLLYGPQGSGKTTLACTAQDHPNMAPVLVLNVEGGLRSVAYRGDIAAEDIRSTEQFEEIFWKIANRDPEYAMYRTIVVDSGSELQTVDLEATVREAIRREQAKNGNKPKRDDEDEFWQEDYGKSTNRLKRLFRYLRDLPVNVIITALPTLKYPGRKNRDEQPDPIECRPGFTQKLGDAVMGYVDFVWYITASPDQQTNQMHRYLLTRDKGIYRAKTRGMRFAEALGEFVVDPTLPDLYNLYLKSETAGNKQG